MRPTDGIQNRSLRDDVTLEPLERAHANAMLQWMGDPEVRANVGVRASPSLERTLQWIESARQDPTCHPFAICLGGRHVGNVVLDRLDTHLGTIRLSIYLGETRSAGIGRTAVALALQHAFEVMQLNKVWLTVHSENARAIRAYERVGFRVEGRLREEFMLGERRLDALYMGVLAHEFVACREGKAIP
jgi:RimJ/RimL family protein N-acetyltransferase